MSTGKQYWWCHPQPIYPQPVYPSTVCPCCGRPWCAPYYYYQQPIITGNVEFNIKAVPDVRE